MLKFLSNNSKRRNYSMEISKFITNVRIHKYKILVIASGLSYPFYKHKIPQIKDKISDYFADKMKDNLQKDERIPKITEAFLKQTINDVLMDYNVRYSALDFTQDIIAQRVIIDSVVKMLLHALQDPIFLQKVQILGQDLGQEIVRDPEINRDVVKMMTRVFQDEEVVFEAGELMKKVILRRDVNDALTKTLSNVFQTEEARDGMTLMLEESFNKVMLDPETIEKFRIFAFNLMTTEIDSKDNKNSLFDLMVKKMMTRREKGEGRSEIENILESEVNRRIEAQKAHENEKIRKVEEDLGNENEMLDFVLTSKRNEEEIFGRSGNGVTGVNLSDILGDDDGE